MSKHKAKLIKKAWTCSANLAEPWYYDFEEIYYADKPSQAKKMALKEFGGQQLNEESRHEENNFGGWKSSFYNGEYCPAHAPTYECGYLDVTAKRAKDYDLVEFMGKEMKRHEIKDRLREIKIAQLPKDQYYYVQDSRQYVGNSVLWWAEGRSGYTTNIVRAHKFSYEELMKLSPRDTDIIWPASHVQEHIQSHVDMQYLDSNKKI